MSVSFAKLLQSGSLPPNELVSPRSTKVLYVFFYTLCKYVKAFQIYIRVALSMKINVVSRSLSHH